MTRAWDSVQQEEKNADTSSRRILLIRIEYSLRRRMKLSTIKLNKKKKPAAILVVNVIRDELLLLSVNPIPNETHNSRERKRESRVVGEHFRATCRPFFFFFVNSYRSLQLPAERIIVQQQPMLALAKSSVAPPPP